MFIVGFAIIAICINGVKFNSERQQYAAAVAAQAAQKAQQEVQKQTQQEANARAQQEAQQRQLAADRAAAAQRAAEEAAQAHANYLARYLIPGFSRTPGVQTVAIVAATETGKLNSNIGNALARRFKTANVEITSSFFTSEFVSDGLFTGMFNGSTEQFGKLELAHSLNTIVLARQTVQYSKNPSLENVTTAAMQLDVVLASVSTPGQSQSWTFTASGAGFNNQTARAMAEDRIIKKITDDKKMSL